MCFKNSCFLVEGDVAGSFAFRKWSNRGFRLWRGGGRTGAFLIIHCFPLSQIQEAFDTNLRQDGVKIMVVNDAAV